jgi:hypothetical protein
MEAVMKAVWRSEHAWVAIKINYIACTFEERGAMTALSKVLIQRRSSNGIEILVDII